MTPEEVARTLYATDAADRFFLIADGVFLPLGDTRLRSMSGALRAVDADVARVYEIQPSHARRLMKGAITGALAEASHQLQQLGILLAVFGKAAEQDIAVLDEERRHAERAERVAKVLNIPVADAMDRESVRERLAEVLIELETELRTRDVTAKPVRADGTRDNAESRAFREHFQQVLTLAVEEVAREHDPFASTMPLALREAFQDHGIQQRLREVAVLLQHTREAVQDVNDLDELDQDILDGDV